MERFTQPQLDVFNVHRLCNQVAQHRDQMKPQQAKRKWLATCCSAT